MNRLLLGLLIAFSAFAQKITVEFDQAADFTKYRTFTIRAGQLNSPNPALNSELVKKQIDNDIESNLTAKGLTQITTGASDLNVRYTLGMSRLSLSGGLAGTGDAYRQGAVRAGHSSDRSTGPDYAITGVARYRNG